MNLFPVTETIRLYNIQVTLEKSTSLVLQHLNKYTEYDIFEYSLQLDRDRQSEYVKLQAQINDILEPLRCKMRLMKNMQLDDIIDFKLFKTEMIVIQENIQNLKYEMTSKLEILEKEKFDILEDIDFYNEKLLQWSEPIKINLNFNINPYKTVTIRNKHHCKEVQEFMDFIHTSGGCENGWRKEDHQMFLNFRKRYKNIDTVAKHLHDALPDISIQEIIAHEEWYKKYIILQNKKKNALKSWQEQKTKTPSLNHAIIPAKVMSVPEPEENIQEKIMKWKIEKQEKMRNARLVEFYKMQRRYELEQQRRKKNDEIKKIVQEWKQSKQIMEQQEILERGIMEEHEKKRRAMEANKLIKQYQSQDDIYILKMKQQRKKEAIAPIIRSKSSHLAKRDSERLLKPTKQWINRVHDDNYYATEQPIISIKSLPKLGIPEWRKKLE